jgi:PAS domain S-box-containing protein
MSRSVRPLAVEAQRPEASAPSEGLSDGQYRSLLERAPMLVWRAGVHAGREYVSSSWLAFTGRSLAEELGSGWLLALHPEDVTACVATYREQFAREQPFEIEYRLRRFDGMYRSILERVVPDRDAGGTCSGFIGSGIDIEGRQARKGARLEFFERSLDNVCVASIEGYFTELNPAWTRTLGWTPDELMSRPSIEFVHPDDREATLLGRARLSAGLLLGPLTNRYRCKDGTYRWFEWRSVAEVDRGVVYAAARDITEQKLSAQRLSEAKEIEERLQRQLILSDRMASVGTLAAGVAHEINNPLAYVAANLQLIVDELSSRRSDAEPLRQMAAEALAGTERIRKIVRGLKTFSRSEEERLRVTDVRSLLDTSINMTMNEIRHRARLIRDYGSIPLVNVDDARLGQVFINLLVNAAQALPETNSAQHQIRIATSTDGAGRAVIEVTDTGPGIPAALLGRIFDPFFTTKPVGIGTGLGLSICQNIVTGMGGEITVRSEEGKGATFRVLLPPALPALVAVPESEAPPQQAITRATVLVVDDEPAIGLVLRRVLREHDVTVVTTARQALDLLAAGKCFDSILSDLMMPDMSGMDFHAELSRLFPDAARRVVFISGGAFTPGAQAFLDRVPNPRIEKPFEPQNVRDIVQRSVKAAE